jgi:hypothetical protein
MSNPIKRRKDLKHLKEILTHFLGSKHFRFKVIVYVFLMFIIISWLPQILENALEEIIKLMPLESFFLARVWLWQLLICAAILIFFILLARKMGKQPHNIHIKSGSFLKGEIMVIFLSPLNVFSKDQSKKDISQKIKKMTAQLNAGKPGEKDITELKTLIKETNWKILLLAIENHVNTLKKVYAITSKDSKRQNITLPGSHSEFPFFKEVFEILFHKKIIVEEFTKSGIDFEDVGQSFKTIETFYENQSGKGIKKRKIVVDVTGGQKTNSSGGALATLSLGRKFQYVSTTDGTVKSYDIEYAPPEE